MRLYKRGQIKLIFIVSTLVIAQVGILCAGLWYTTKEKKQTKQNGYTINSSQKTEVLGSSTEFQRYDVKAKKKSLSGINSDNLKLQLSISLKNKTNEIVQISPGQQMAVKDSTGKIYHATATFLSTDTSIGGPLAPQEVLSLLVDFEVPENAVITSFLFEENAQSKIIETAL